MPRNLKVFRTAIGFHDAYVAAPSRKAALRAWGTDKDLFARGVAEEVTDPALMAEALAEPNTVFRRLRDTPPEPAKDKRKATSRSGKATRAERVPARPPPPPPSRDEVEAARRALDKTLDQHKAEQSELVARERALSAERRSIEQRHEQELRALQSALHAAEQDYEARLKLRREKAAK
jgi:uncharacterized membrane protein YccC